MTLGQQKAEDLELQRIFGVEYSAVFFRSQRTWALCWRNSSRRTWQAMCTRNWSRRRPMATRKRWRRSWSASTPTSTASSPATRRCRQPRKTATSKSSRSCCASRPTSRSKSESQFISRICSSSYRIGDVTVRRRRNLLLTSRRSAVVTRLYS